MQEPFFERGRETTDEKPTGTFCLSVVQRADKAEVSRSGDEQVTTGDNVFKRPTNKMTQGIIPSL